MALAKSVAAAALAMAFSLGATTVSALTITGGAGTANSFFGLNGGPLVDGTTLATFPGYPVDLGTGTNSVQFGWADPGPAAITSTALVVIDFTTIGLKSLTFDGYFPDSAGTDVTGLLFLKQTAPSVWTPLATASAPLVSDCDGPLPVPVTCTKIAGPSTTATDTAMPGLLYENLGAGTYRIGIYETSAPGFGLTSFTLAEVPLPASALLLVGAFGALGWRARRKSA